MSQSTEISTGILDDASGGPLLYAWFATIAIGLLIGLYGAFRLTSEGTVALGIESQLPWGILISTYVFLVLLSTGICIGVTPLATVFGREEFDPIVKRGLLLSIVTLMAGGVVILLSLGQTLRSIPALLLSPNPSSAMWWMIVFYGIYGVALIAEFALLEWRNASRRSVAIVALIAPIFAGGTLGAIFSSVDVRPYYGDFFGPAYMLVTAVLSGVALITLVALVEKKVRSRDVVGDTKALLTDTLAKYLGLMLTATLFLVAWKFVLGTTATADAVADAHAQMFFGPSAWWVWGVGIVLGLVVPLALVLFPQTRTTNGVLAASGLTLIGLFAARLEYVVGGQVVALVNDPAYQYPFASYTPSGVEIAVVILGFAVAALLYTLGDRVFDLHELPAHGGQESMTPTPTDPAPGGDDDD